MMMMMMKEGERWMEGFGPPKKFGVAPPMSTVIFFLSPSPFYNKHSCSRETANSSELSRKCFFTYKVKLQKLAKCYITLHCYIGHRIVQKYTFDVTPLL